MAGGRWIARLLAAGAVLAVTLAGTGGVAGADLADGATMTVSPTSGQRGDDFTVQGTGCLGENAVAYVEVDGEFANGISPASNGSWTLQLTVPDDATLGNHTIQGFCDTYDTSEQYAPVTFSVFQLQGDPPIQPPPPQAAASASSATAGSTVTVTGSGFQPGEQVTVTLFSAPVHLATVDASTTGTVSVAVKVPSSTPAGAHRIELRGVTSGRVASVPLTVAAKAAGTTGLARTGDSSDLLAKVAASLILAGVGTIAIATGRRELLL